jgi:hypothetical protein
MSVQAQVPLIPGFAILSPRPADLATAAPGLVPSLWHGYLAQGRVTALVSQAKSGKTTLVSYVLARMAQGGQISEHLWLLFLESGTIIGLGGRAIERALDIVIDINGHRLIAPKPAHHVGQDGTPML